MTAGRYDAATNDESCPECGQTNGVRWVGSTPTPSADSRSCPHCGLECAYMVELPAAVPQ